MLTIGKLNQKNNRYYINHMGSGLGIRGYLLRYCNGQCTGNDKEYFLEYCYRLWTRIKGENWFGAVIGFGPEK